MKNYVIEEVVLIPSSEEMSCTGSTLPRQRRLLLQAEPHDTLASAAADCERTTRFRSPKRQGFLFTTCADQLWRPPSSISSGYWGLGTRGQSDLSVCLTQRPPYNAEIFKIAWIFTSTAILLRYLVNATQSVRKSGVRLMFLVSNCDRAVS
jgi:hypothetical protein